MLGELEVIYKGDNLGSLGPADWKSCLYGAACSGLPPSFELPSYALRLPKIIITGPYADMLQVKQDHPSSLHVRRSTRLPSPFGSSS